MQLALESSK
ncbi:hypothetical protein GQ607_011783 [Colletotrichum asianum]|uniref:Uncharacterized protein n=1 Tax=Colletotrichum asianum TaxID=702518 RepID=A0A8H3ZRI3_9PEZI|nr:hypothetical protein GQ607_011783 [Colletotrichum asianum]